MIIDVVIAENYPVVRYGLQEILEAVDGIRVVGETTCRNKVIQQVATGRCDVLLLGAMACDVALFEVLATLQVAQPALATLLVGLRIETEFTIRALRAGAAGFITIDQPGHEFIRAIQLVAHGRKYICDELAEALAWGLHHTDNKPHHHSLSNREYQVMCLLGTGKTPTETADLLGLGKTTIATYRKRVLDKLNLHSNAELVRYVVEQQLFHP